MTKLYYHLEQSIHVISKIIILGLFFYTLNHTQSTHPPSRSRENKIFPQSQSHKTLDKYKYNPHKRKKDVIITKAQFHSTHIKTRGSTAI